MAHAFAATGAGNDGRQALEQAMLGMPPSRSDLVFLFASYHYAGAYEALVHRLHETVGSAVVVGCSGQGVISTGREVEEEPALALMALGLPGARLSAVRLVQRDLRETHGRDGWLARMGVAPSAVNAWVILADPFTFDTDAFLSGLSEAYPGVPLVGGMASGQPGRRGTWLFSGTDVIKEGAIALAVGGAWRVHAVVSQGAEPIGQTWTITGTDGNLVRSIGGRPALDIVIETLGALPPDMRQRASQNLLVGLAMDEYKDEFGRGDFLIRNLIGADQETGAIAVGAEARLGQTIQLQLRDAAAADAELQKLLEGAAEAIGETAAGALLCSCNGRGASLFGSPNHDAVAVADHFGQLPVAGLFCNGEIGPVGGVNFVHGFTASIAFFVPSAE